MGTQAVPQPHQFNVAEYYRMAKAGILSEDDRVELIEGRIIDMPPIGVPHASHVTRLDRLFQSAVGDSAVVIVQNPLRLSEHNEPMPDLILAKPSSNFYGSAHPTPRDVFLVVEVSDTTLAYDQRVKGPLYARYGVPEVWIVDINRDLIAVRREPGPTGYRTSLIRRRGQRLALATRPDLQFAVDDILG